MIVFFTGFLHRNDCYKSAAILIIYDGELSQNNVGLPNANTTLYRIESEPASTSGFRGTIVIQLIFLYQLRKKLVIYYVLSIALNGSETWSIENWSFEM